MNRPTEKSVAISTVTFVALLIITAVIAIIIDFAPTPGVIQCRTFEDSQFSMPLCD